MGLTLTRRPGQSLIVNDELEIMVTEIKGNQVRITCFGDPKKFHILRSECFDDPEFRVNLEARRKARDGIPGASE